MWQGSFVAIITPFDQKGRIDQKALEKLVLWQIEEGTDGIVCCGTTGEGMTLSDQEREEVFLICRSIAKDKIPIVVGTGTADTRHSVHLTERMMQRGASGCLIPTPYYNKPTQKGAILHVAEIAKVGLPVIIYNNPGRTLKLELETVVEMAKIPGVVAYKDSTGDIAFIRKVKKAVSIALFAGDDHLTFEILQAGGDGAISVIGNLFPKEWKEMIALCLRKEWETAFAISERFKPIYQALFLETNPQCVKYGMSLLGKCEEHLRLPLIPPSSCVREKIKNALSQISTGAIEVSGKFH